MQDGCKAYMDSYMASNGSYFMLTWTILKNHLSKACLTLKPQDHGTPHAHSQPSIYSILSWVRTRLKINSLKHLIEGPVTYGFTLQLRARDHTT